MKIIVVVAVALFMVVGIIYGFRFAMMDAMNMYPRPKKRADDEAHLNYRKSLLAELAALDQQIADAEGLTASTCDDVTLHRATEILAEAREIRRDVERKLTAE